MSTPTAASAMRRADEPAEEHPRPLGRAPPPLEDALVAADRHGVGEVRERRRDGREGGEGAGVELAERPLPGSRVDLVAAEQGVEQHEHDQRQQDREEHRDRRPHERAHLVADVADELDRDRGRRHGRVPRRRRAAGTRPPATAGSTTRPPSSIPRATAHPVTAWTAAVGVVVANSTRSPLAHGAGGQHGVEVAGRRRGRQVEAHDRRAGAADQLVRRPLGDEPAAGEHADAVGEVLRLVEVVRRQQHRRALGAQLAHELPRLAPGRRVEAGRRLVEEQQRRLADDAEGEVEAASLAARQVARPAGRAAASRPTSSTTSATGRRRRVARAVDRHRLADRQLVLDAGRLQDDADAVAEVASGAAGILAEHRDVAGRPRAVPLEDLDRRRLAGAVLAEQGVDLALVDVEAEPVDRPDRAVVLRAGRGPRSPLTGARALAAVATRSAGRCRCAAARRRGGSSR